MNRHSPQSRRRKSCTPLTPQAVKKARRAEILSSIERVTMSLIQPVAEDQMPALTILDRCWSNTIFDEYLKLKPANQLTKVHIKYAHKQSREKFAILVHVLSIIHEHLIKKTTCTKRELFYQDKTIYQSQQSKLDSAVNDICCLLEASPWELNVMPTSKGLVAGPLTFLTADGESVNCKRLGGVQVPQDVQSITSISSSAQAIIIVEKDAAFQKILNEGGLKMPWILITGKGVPDINTRMLVKKLWTTLKFPVYAMVDADPYGIEIMCTYRFGSLQLVHLSDVLATPTIKWLGVLPSDINDFIVPSMPLTQRDLFKIKNLQARTYVKAHPLIQKQLQVMLDTNQKADIEAITKIAPSYLTNVFITKKILYNLGI